MDMDEHASDSISSASSTLRWWFLLSTGSWMLGSSIGRFIGYLIAIYATSSMDRTPAAGPGDFHFGQGMIILLVSLLVSSASAGLLLGLINGLLQAPFLRSYQISTWRWVSLSMIAWTIVSVVDTWRVRFVFPQRSYAAVFAALLATTALLVGIYWLALRRRVPGAPFWAASSVVGYLIVNTQEMLQTIILLSGRQ